MYALLHFAWGYVLLGAGCACGIRIFWRKLRKIRENGNRDARKTTQACAKVRGVMLLVRGKKAYFFCE